jgi:hypothetical protein
MTVKQSIKAILDVLATMSIQERGQAIREASDFHRERTETELTELRNAANLDQITGGVQNAGSQRGRRPQAARQVSGTQTGGGQQRSRGTGISPSITLFDEVLASIDNLKRAKVAPTREAIANDWKARKVKTTSNDPSSLISAYIPIQKNKHETIQTTERGVHDLTDRGAERVKWYREQRANGAAAPSAVGNTDDAKGNRSNGKQASKGAKSGKQSGRRASANA